MNDNSHISSLIHEINWPYIAVILGMCVGWLVWAARQVFSTKVHLDKQLSAHEEREEKKLNAFNEQNTREHRELKEDLKWIRNHLFKQNGDL